MSVQTEEEAVNLIHEVSEMLQRAGFNLNKWVCYSKHVFRNVEEDKRASIMRSLPIDSIVNERVLGVNWNVAKDEFRVKVKLSSKPYTRRGILSMWHSLFDPMGFVAPVLLEPKLLMRELSGREWDEALQPDEVERWEAWLESLQRLESLRIDRCFKSPDLVGPLTYELHHFADASKLAYKAVSYLRITGKESRLHCVFLMGKGHLAPVLTTTIPRLRLLAAVTAVRLVCSHKKELPLTVARTVFW